MKYPNDAQRLKAVLMKLDLTAYELCKAVGYKSTAGLYAVNAGAAPLSKKMATLIASKFPTMNILYMIGKSPQMIYSKQEALNQSHIINQKTILKEDYAQKFEKMEEDMRILLETMQAVLLQNEELLKIVKKS